VNRCLLLGCGWGLDTKNRVKYDVGCHCCSVVELVVVVCFFVNVVFLYGVGHSPFFWWYAGRSWFVLVFPGSGSVPTGVL
jgi:hypothetical protein